MQNEAATPAKPQGDLKHCRWHLAWPVLSTPPRHLCLGLHIRMIIQPNNDAKLNQRKSGLLVWSFISFRCASPISKAPRAPTSRGGSWRRCMPGEATQGLQSTILVGTKSLTHYFLHNFHTWLCSFTLILHRVRLFCCIKFRNQNACIFWWLISITSWDWTSLQIH